MAALKESRMESTAQIIINRVFLFLCNFAQIACYTDYNILLYNMDTYFLFYMYINSVYVDYRTMTMY